MASLLGFYKNGNLSRLKLLILGALAVCLALDTSFGMLMDVFYLQNIKEIFTDLGLVLYLVLFAVYVLGFSILLNLITKGNQDTAAFPFLRKLRKVTIPINYLIFACVCAVLVQMLLMRNYSTYFLLATASLGYALAALNFGVLSSILLKWFMVDKNKIIFTFACVAIAMCFNAVNSLIFFDSVLILNTEPTISQNSIPEYNLFLAFDPNQIIAISQSISVAIYVSLTWLGIVFVLKHNIKKIGKPLFFLIVIPPFVAAINFHVSSFAFIYPDNPAIIMITPEAHLQFVIYIISFLVCAFLFGLGYFSISRHIDNERLRNYTRITGFGFLLFYISGFATILNHSFPPYGLISLSLVGASSYLMLIGIYYSATSVSQDMKLRMTIKKTLLNDTEFISKIGNAEVLQSYQKKVIDIVNKNKENIKEESGMETSLTVDDMREYLEEVRKELMESKQKTST